jgi:geranylgeranyl diphosphate synthase, type I
MLGLQGTQPGAGARTAAMAAGCPALDPVSAPLANLLSAFLGQRVAELARIDPPLERIGTEVRDLVLAGGKRLRPAFVYWGHRATGAPHDDGVLHPAGAVELLHNFALIHDDVMDRSRPRGGRHTAHEPLAGAQSGVGRVGDPGWFGVGGAILAGDLAFVWADQLFDSAPLPADALAGARAVFTRLRVEVMAGQYLDLRLAGRTDADESDSLRVALLKSGRYTVTRPLQLGAALARSDDDVLDAALRAYGDSVGIAFQLRDDILGLFGDPDETGKSAVSDLREGKRTMLILRALGAARHSERRELAGMLGRADVGEGDADRAREIVTSTGALAGVERYLEEQQERARHALAPVQGAARPALEQLAELALHREG